MADFLNILIVDDHATNRKLLRAQLEAEGHTVVDAADGVEALAVLERQPVDGVVSDILMPRMDGYSLCQKIRQHPKLSALALILYTSTYDSKTDRQLADSVGADGFIIKPASTPVILQALREAMQKAGEREAPSALQPNESQVLHQYSEVLVRKLEERNTELQDAMAKLRMANEEIWGLNRDLERRVEERTTELSRVHDDLRRANTELANASKHKDEFLANMSHELRTPLNSILGLSEALLEQISGPLTDRQIKSVTTIAKSGQHLLALINDILDLSKIEAGKLELHVEPLNVDEFCQSCLAFVRTQAMEKKIGVTFEHNGHVAHFPADTKRLKQILVNLLSNAVKFTPPGGRIGLTVASPEEEKVVSFTVWDTGVGIAPADQAKLFRSFTQIDSGLTRVQEGTGLGLALVAKLVELHGGSVALESEPGKGSRFIVTLPRDAASRLPPESTAKDEPDRRGYRRALIIEDDPTSGALLVNYLTELGLEGVLHLQGEQSLEAVLQERPDVILLDILLPNDSGWVVLTRLKEHPVTMHIPVVVISVVDEPEKSLALGAAAHFTKPVSREQLAGFLQRVTVPRTLPAPPGVAVLPPTGPTILLAEDNEANIETMGGYLSDKGYSMHYASNGLAAVKLARELHPALILMDIQLPVLDGLSAIRELRADASFRNIPIVALTALAMVGDRERCLAAGATDYMSKPVKLMALAELVKRLLPAGEIDK